MEGPVLTAPRFLRRFLAYYLPIVAAGLGLGLGLERYYVARSIESLTAEQEGLLAAELRIASRALRGTAQDLLVIAGQPTLRELGATGKESARQEVARYLLLLATHKRLYDQLRFMDRTGKERVRVNLDAGEAVLVDDAELQDKHDRYFFKEAIKLKPGEIYVSPFDLSIENGKIEVPHKPVIRFCAPLIDERGTAIGVASLSYLGAEMIADLRRAAEPHPGSLMLLEEGGHWLLGDPADEWAFMFPERKGNTFARRYPIAAKALDAAPTGRVTSTEGLFAFATIRPLEVIRQGNPGLEYLSYPWRLVHRIAPAELDARLRPIRRLGRELAAAIALAGALAVWLLLRTRMAREAAEASLRASEAEARKLAMVASRTKNGVIISAPDGRIEWVNEGFERLTGYSLAEAVGQRPNELLVGPDTDRAALAARARAVDTGEGFQVELLMYRKDGQTRWLVIDGQAVRDEAGRVLHWITVQADITEQKRAEEDARRAEEEANRARWAAEDASRTKSAFLANMSHELRTPMNAIIGYGEMLMEEAADAGHEAYLPDLRKIHGAARHLLGLINDILDVSKIEAGKMELHLETFALRPMLDEVVATIAPLAAKNENRLAVEVHGDPGELHADLVKVRQSLLNLLSNACKFTQQGSVTLEVRRQGATLTFAVSDTGIGMSEAQLGRLFQAFVQADSSTTRKYGGSGLGLVLTRTFARLMGGDVTVTSVEGQGTTFSMTLPTVVAPPHKRS